MRFYFSMICTRVKNGRSEIVGNNGIIEAANEAEAIGKATLWGRKRCPSRCGWQDHNISVGSIEQTPVEPDDAEPLE